MLSILLCCPVTSVMDAGGMAIEDKYYYFFLLQTAAKKQFRKSHNRKTEVSPTKWEHIALMRGYFESKVYFITLSHSVSLFKIDAEQQYRKRSPERKSSVREKLVLYLRRPKYVSVVRWWSNMSTMNTFSTADNPLNWKFHDQLSCANRNHWNLELRTKNVVGDCCKGTNHRCHFWEKRSLSIVVTIYKNSVL